MFCIRCKKEKATNGLRCAACDGLTKAELQKTKVQREQKPILRTKKVIVNENPLPAFQGSISPIAQWLKSVGAHSGKLVIPVTGLMPAPRLIHFIWIGPHDTTTPIKNEYVENITKMMALNKDYKVWVWTDKDERIPHIEGVTKKNVSKCLGDLLNALDDTPTAEVLAKAIDGEWSLTRNFAAVSDILRVLILYKHGGIYCDTDNKPLMSFPSPMLLFGMRVGLSGDLGAVTNALMASTEGFIFFHYLARRIAANFEQLLTYFGSHQSYSDAFQEYKVKDVSSCNAVVNDLSGPACLNILMDETKIGGMNLTAGFLMPWKGFAIPKKYVHVGSDQNWL